MRDQWLPFAQPDLDGCELAEIAAVLASGWLTTGLKTHQFEAEFAAWVGAQHAVALNSCTAALHLALEAIDLGHGDEVITTPYTFAATAEVVHYLGARPVFVDICPDDLNINPALINAAVTSNTRAIIPVHIGGLPADLDAIDAVADRYGLAVIEDAAHAFPSRYKGRCIGATRRRYHQPPSAACFSFYATKTITTAEGGMLCTDDEDLASRCRIMALHGISRDAWKRYAADGCWQYDVIAPGYKYNMTDVAAALGLAQLRKAQLMWQRRREIAQIYDAAFGLQPELQIPFNRADCQHAWHLYVLRLHLDRLNIDRSKFVQELRQRNIGASVHFIPLHMHSYYRKTYGYRPDDFPVALAEYQRAVSLPIYTKMSDRDVQDVIDAVLEVVQTWRRSRVSLGE
jgi:dTDP-4-amino-4,6-dideoxygalactose transaminase